MPDPAVPEQGMESPSPEPPAAKKRKAKPSTAWGGALVSDGRGLGVSDSGRTGSSVQIFERDTALCTCQAQSGIALLSDDCRPCGIC